MRLALLALIAVACAAFLVPETAVANGRFPATMTITVDPDDPGTLVVGATFGLLLTRDGGESWRWACESGVGYAGIWDPVYAIESGSDLFVATTFRGVRLSEDDGCTWDLRGGDHETDWFSDLVLREGGAWLFSTASGGRTNGVFVSYDQARTLESTSLLSDSRFYRGLVLGPSGGARVYVVEYSLEPLEATIHRSDDGGLNWSPTNLTLDGNTEVITLGVDPTDEDVLFFRQPVGLEWELRRSSDGGTSSELLLTTEDAMEAFALSSDGQTILVGTRMGDVRRSEDGGASFDPTAAPIKAQCFTVADDVVFSCAENWDDEFAVGRSDDWGDTWTGLLRYSEIRSPLDCAEGTPVDEICDPMFWVICQQLGIEAPGCEGPVNDAGPGDSDVDTDGDTDGDVDGDGDRDGGPPILNGGDPDPKDDCGCSAAGVPGIGAALPVAWALLGRRGRRRRRR